MDSSFGNGDGAPPTPAGAAAPDLSAATQRFQSCRWRKAADSGIPDHCTHRDVLPMAGSTGFVPDSWCADCAFYKAKRMPRKKESPPESDSWRRW